MTFQKIEKIEIIQTNTIMSQSYSTTLTITDPTNISLKQDRIDIKGGLGNAFLGQAVIPLRQLFHPDTNIYIYGYFYNNEKHSYMYGKYNLLTKELE